MMESGSPAAPLAGTPEDDPAGTQQQPAAPRPRRRRIWLRILLVLLGLVLLAVVAAAVAVVHEMRTSHTQARLLARYDRKIGYTVGKGPSDSIVFPDPGGPYDRRFGYAQLPDFIRRLQERGFTITQQARDSDTFLEVARHGLYPPYPEKDQAGLTLLDATGVPLYRATSPEHVYRDFAQVPPILATSLAFIEDRKLLDDANPRRNPAVNWGRFTLAAIDQVIRLVVPSHAAPGGSTLATQIVKFRHSPGGVTVDGKEKLRQMASASLGAYAGGENTLQARRQILVHYLDTEPLAAHAGEGEVSGIGDGLAVWYGRDFSEVNRLLGAIPVAAADDVPAARATASEDQALAFKQALSLLIAQRAPSYYLVEHNEALEDLTDRYLRLLAANGIIAAQLRDAALHQRLQVRRGAQSGPRQSFTGRKGSTFLRTELAGLLGVPTVYDLDRLDLTAQATLDAGVQEKVARALTRVQTRQGAKAAGLVGYSMLRPQDDPSHIAFSFTLYERTGGRNVLRLQTDSVNEPFDLNQGARLNLGSTAKLRTLILYLQIVADLQARYAGHSPQALAAVRPDPLDPITTWVLDYLRWGGDPALGPMLEAAVERTYSGDPTEVFATGGGQQRFTNFEPSENVDGLTVRESFRRSINLVFVRLMRDIVRYEMVRQAGPSTRWLQDPQIRDKYLRHFVDMESRQYLHRFYVRYHGKTPQEALQRLLSKVPKVPLRLAAALRSVAPDEPLAWFDREMRAALHGRPAAGMDADRMQQLYEKYGPDKFDLNDRAYLARVHPLALWVVHALRVHPDASETELREQSSKVRVASYEWLFKSRVRDAQDRRILEMIEREAYDPIAQAWRALGYPFASITPSYGSAVGASGDRPAALSELMGILVSDGRRQPAQDLLRLSFAAGTPYETRLAAGTAEGRRVLPREVVAVARELLRGVVVKGTARRLAAGLPLGKDATLPVAGKTGTGDQRMYGRRVNRSANFMFTIGDRFYGTVTAYAHEPYAARYTFSSAMAVQLLKYLGPTLAPILREGE